MESWPTKKYLDAVERENNLRDAAFLDLPTRIQGLLLAPMTLRHWIILNGIGSPFLVGGLPSLEQLIQFFWVMNPKFTPGRSFRRGRFIASCRSLLYGQAVLSCRALVRDTFQDGPPSSGNGDEAPGYSFAASIIHALASDYGWTEDYILNIPLRRVFQYMKIARMTREIVRGETPRKWNPSERIRLDYIQQARTISSQN
jgi:hypothetical protein